MEYVVRKEPNVIKVIENGEIRAEFHDEDLYETFVKGVRSNGDSIWIENEARYEKLEK